MEKRQYLIVTDNPDLGQSIQSHFDDDQLVELHCATTTPQAFAHILKVTYCLIMMDLQFSNMNQREMIQIIRARQLVQKNVVRMRELRLH